MNSQPFSLLGPLDLHLLNQGDHRRLWTVLGAHLVEREGVAGCQFAVWAPNAVSVCVVGSFNAWNVGAHPLYPRWDGSGIHEGFVPGVERYALYKFAIETRQGAWLEKADPLARRTEAPPRTASVVWESDYAWNDAVWMADRGRIPVHKQPLSIYEVHLASWKRKPNHESLTYAEFAEELVAYAVELGCTHVELMPVMEHPFDGSWGYQICGYYAPTARFGDPDGLKYLVDRLHAAEIGVILDWVPSHFPGDPHGLHRFDGSALYEHANPKQGFHPDWNSYIFNYGRNEVRSFLISNALYWLEEFHIDGIRVDAVASMLYLDYSRKEGEWIPNMHGGRENLESLHFIRQLNTAVYAEHPDVLMLAEESTSWPGVTRTADSGGLGFGFKWMMGWMHDTLEFFKRDPIHRHFHLNELSFSLTYAFSEQFCLPLSHDEMAHGKGSLLQRMPGDEWQRFANVRILFAWMFAHPGSKLLFMGGEFGMRGEWDHDGQLDWWALDLPEHRGVQRLVARLNRLYRSEPALYAAQYEPAGFEWIEHNDWHNAVVSALRRDPRSGETLLVVLNLIPQPHSHYRLGIPEHSEAELVLNTDASDWGGSDQRILHHLLSEPREAHGKAQSVLLELPALSALFYRLKTLQ
ncbi:1,4-alpha-glucan branching protein GlgB [bacterium]|nr:1,4-alpha-glucan branching protein GlgB [bacterium]